MRYVLAVFVLCFLSVTARAETVDYSLTVQGSVVGDFAWELQTVGFIPDVSPQPVLDAEHNCIANCNPNFFNNFVSVSAPSNGNGCGISGVWLYPDYGPAPFTEFSPNCDGIYTGFSGGAMPDAGVLGTWSWSWDNGNGTFTNEALSITDPPGPINTPEPSNVWLLGFGLALLFCARSYQEITSASTRF